MSQISCIQKSKFNIILIELFNRTVRTVVHKMKIIS